LDSKSYFFWPKTKKGLTRWFVVLFRICEACQELSDVYRATLATPAPLRFRPAATSVPDPALFEESQEVVVVDAEASCPAGIVVAVAAGAAIVVVVITAAVSVVVTVVVDVVVVVGVVVVDIVVVSVVVVGVVVSSTVACDWHGIAWPVLKSKKLLYICRNC
jgi:hypothetical protein